MFGQGSIAGKGLARTGGDAHRLGEAAAGLGAAARDGAMR
jgi:hypothetical protein